MIRSYEDVEKHKESRKLRGKWSKSLNYEVFEFALCYECVYYQIDSKRDGTCLAMEEAGARSGVLGQGVCDYFLSPQGTDINGKKTERRLGKRRIPSGRITRRNKWT